MKRGFKSLVLSACFATMFLVGCEQPVSSVISGEDVAYSMNGDNVLGGDSRGKNDLRGIFQKLNLTGEQQAAIAALQQAHHACETPILQALKASESAIAADFKAQRRAIETSDMTKEEKRAAIHALEVAQKEAMAPVRAEAEVALKACQDTFYAGIGEILTDEQDVIWAAWLANPTNGGGKGDGKGGDKKDGDKKDGDKKDDKAGIFKKLNLTATQQGEIDILIQAKRDCETPILAALKTSERTIAEPFNAERAAIKAALADGSMTREEAHTQLRSIDARQKAAMATAHTEAQAALKLCRDTFNAAVREKLTDEQKVIWDRFIEGQDTGKDKGNHDGRKDHHRGHGKRK